MTARRPDQAVDPARGQWHPAAQVRARRDAVRARSPIAPLLMRLYHVRRLRGLVLEICQRLEGGPLHSATLRAILRRHHGAEVGRYSYGPILSPGVLPHGTRVGAYCSVGTELIVRRRDHPLDRPTLHPFFYNHRLGYLVRDTVPKTSGNPLEIGHDVWIGDRVIILAGCQRIGNGSVIAAGAVVTRDVAPYTVMAGVPARPLRRRLDDQEIARIEASRWWEHDIADLIADPPLEGMLGPQEAKEARTLRGHGA